MKTSTEIKKRLERKIRQEERERVRDCEDAGFGKRGERLRMETSTRVKGRRGSQGGMSW